MDKKYNAFLSHNSQDKPIVEKIAKWLEDESKLSVWLDKWNLIPGDPWQEEIEIALDGSECCVVFLGPYGMGAWQNEEMRAAMEKRVSGKTLRVVPVLLPGAIRPDKESQLPPFLRRLTWVEFREDRQEEDSLHRLVCGIKGIKPGRDEKEIKIHECPYRGLEVFREQDQRFFLGRDAVVQRLLDKLNKSRFLAVLGPSGSGKSSVVQAGLIPHLRDNSLVTLFTPQERPIEELAFALRKCYPENHMSPVEQLIKRLKESGENIHYIAREILENDDKKNLVIVIDQFEELFTQTRSEEERRQFIFAVLHAVEVSKGPVKIILTIRSDFMGKCAFYPDLNMYVSDYFFQVEPMSEEELRSAIEEPARKVRLHFEEGLVNRILKDVKGAPAELPLLEHALLELYDRRKGNQLTSQAYDEIGGIEGALVKRAESEYEKLDDFKKEILRKMFVLRLVQSGEGTEDTRRKATKDELLAIGGDSRIAEEVLNQWTNARLITVTRDLIRQKDMVEVAHEALIRKWDRIQAWMAEHREEARQMGILRQAALEWQQADKKKDYLFQGVRLIQMESNLKSYSGDLTKPEIEFVNACISRREALEKEKKKKQKKKLLAAWSFVIVILMALVSSLYLLYNLNVKEQAAKYQLAVNLWENARNSREKGNKLVAMHKYAEALRLNQGPGFNKLILFDMNDLWLPYALQYLFLHEDKILGAQFNFDGTKILAWSDDNAVCLWNVNTGKQIGQALKHNNAVCGATFNKDGTRILTSCSDGIARLWDVSTCKQIEPALKHDGTVRGAIFNRDETQILTWSSDETARLWDASTGYQIMPALKHNGPVEGAIFNKDETRILTWSADKTAKLWNAKTGAQIKPDFNHEYPVGKATFNKDETRILTWNYRHAKLWNVKTGVQDGLGLKNMGYYKLAFAYFYEDEALVLTLYKDGTDNVWDVRTGKSFATDMIFQIKFEKECEKEDTENIVELYGAKAYQWDISIGKQIGPELKFWKFDRNMIYNRDRTRFLSWGSDRIAKLYLNAGLQFEVMFDIDCCLQNYTVNSNKLIVLTHFDEKSKLFVLDLKSREKILKPLNHINLLLTRSILNKTGTRILTWSDNKITRLWDTKTGKQIGLPMKHDNEVNGAIFNFTESAILTWSEDRTAKLWDVNTGEQIGPSLKHDENIYGATFNADETLILTWDSKENARLWNIKEGKQIGPTMKYAEAAFFYDEEAAVIIMTPGAVLKWDITVDYDFPPDKIKLQVMALTGTKFNPETMEVEDIDPEEWRKIKKEYMEFAREHYKTCKYPHANVFRRLFPEEAKKVRQLDEK